MALFPDYVTLAELKSALAITDTNDDAELGFAISASSRAIDHATNRQFGQLATVAARYYAPHLRKRRWRVEIDDLMTTAGGMTVKVDEDADGTFERTLTLDTDFRMFPYNAAGDSEPWTELRAEAGVSLPAGERTVEVTARWGWSAVPDAVVQACLTQAGRLFKRKDSPFGIAGSPELGSEVRLLARLDPDVQMLVSSVRRYGGAA